MYIYVYVSLVCVFINLFWHSILHTPSYSHSSRAKFRVSILHPIFFFCCSCHLCLFPSTLPSFTMKNTSQHLFSTFASYSFSNLHLYGWHTIPLSSVAIFKHLIFHFWFRNYILTCRQNTSLFFPYIK